MSSTRLIVMRKILAEHGPMTAEAMVREMLKLGHDVSVHETLPGKTSSLLISLWRLEKAGIVAREGKGRSARWRYKTSQPQTPQSL
ncbi:hypothetical protein [Bradyrhizobium sp. Leo121]|uniref:hypothetical protein n=1 Tax=Bradyrhizobium sp. Leo121 TaxID=1571195 RepID=UPI001028844E|nr:hypothetical protein [Bradyrhizobium sp. Leo121]